MRRGITVTWHLVSFLVAVALYFVFVLPRWWELTGTWPHGVGTGMRIFTGVLIALTAVPVLLSLLKARKPEFGIPQLALNLRVVSIVGQIAAGVLIITTAVAEIWVDLDAHGQILFGIYGAAAATALLGAAAFYLALLAERPPPPPKPLKPKDLPREEKKAQAEETEADAEEAETESAEADEVEDTEAEVEAEDTEPEPEPGPEAEDPKAPTGKSSRLRNRRGSRK